MKKTPIIKDDNILVFNIKENFPEGLSRPTSTFLRKKRGEISHVDIGPIPKSRKRYVTDTRREKKIKFKALVAKSDYEYNEICNRLRDSGYEEYYVTDVDDRRFYYLSPMNEVDALLNEEKELNKQGIKTKILYFNGWYSLWSKVR